MLERLRLTDFKSFADEQAELSPLTLLVGANASGKSNFLDALRFLQQTKVDRSFSEILDGEERSAGAWEGIRGGAREAARVDTSVFAIESTWLVPIAEDEPVDGAPSDESKLVQITHRIACETSPEVKLLSESLGRARSEGSLFKTGAIKADAVELPWPPVMSKKPDARTTSMSRDRSVLWTILGSINPGSPSIPAEVAEHAEALSAALGKLHFLDIQPRRMRGYGNRRQPLGDDGGNISGVLARICDDPEERRTLVEWLAEVCAPELADLDFIEVPELGDVMAVLVEKGGRRITARSLSDGTLRFLGMLVALRTAEPGSVIAMEEIEADLHPTRIRILIEYLRAVTRERDVQIIATTHSPVVLTWLDDETLRRAIVFGRVPEREGTLMRRLGDLPEFSEIVKRKGIDQLFTTGWLEMAL